MKQNKIPFIKQLSAYSIRTERFVAMAGVKSGQPLIRIITMMLPITGLHTTASRVRAIVVFLRHVYVIFKHNGAKGLCIRLKVYAVTLQQAIGGFRVKDITELKVRVSRTNRGLPRIIPRVQRRDLLAHPELIRFYLTLFNLYRLIPFKHDLRLSSLTKTIIAPAKETASAVTYRVEMLFFIPMFFQILGRVIGMNAASLKRELIQEHELARLCMLNKSGPTTKSMHGVDWDAITPLEKEEVMDKHPFVSSHPISVVEAAQKLEDNNELRDAAHFFLGLFPEKSPVREIWRRSVSIRTDEPVQKTPALGRLSVKEEPAGKARVFAMVDPWTQWFCKPLHLTIFSHILPGIPQDGTMDQMKPIKALLANRKYDGLYSLDLSAATDRLPIWLQKAILSHFVPEGYAQHWADLLVKRDYRLTLTNNNTGFPVNYYVRYAVGQPMGAYSSWAMLALTHHFIVQFCAWRVTAKVAWFEAYAILGDDVVIGDKLVARQYLRVMKALGVGVGLHKSLLSQKGIALEFAKRTFYQGTDVSPVSFAELQAAMTQPAAAVAFIRKWNLSLNSFIKAAGYGFKVLGSIQKPLGVLNAKVRLVILAMNTPVTVEEIQNFFKLGMPKSGRALVETQEIIDFLVSSELKRMKAALNELRHNLYTLEKFHLRAKFIASQIERTQCSKTTWGLNYILPLVKEIQFQTQIHAKGMALMITDQISGQLVNLMLKRYELDFATLYEGLISLQKMVADLPINSLSYQRVVDVRLKGLTDTVHIRMWKRLSKYLQGTAKVQKVDLGINMGYPGVDTSAEGRAKTSSPGT